MYELNEVVFCLVLQVVDDILDFIVSEGEMGKLIVIDFWLGFVIVFVLFVCEQVIILFIC